MNINRLPSTFIHTVLVHVNIYTPDYCNGIQSLLWSKSYLSMPTCKVYILSQSSVHCTVNTVGTKSMLSKNCTTSRSVTNMFKLHYHTTVYCVCMYIPVYLGWSL